MKRSIGIIGAAVILSAIIIAPSFRTAGAHCDTMDGPVVVDARNALDAGDVTRVLKWVKSDHEGELREAFQQALAVRKLGAHARTLADTHFFETLVRLHRAGEGEPFTGLKPAGEHDPVVEAADGALESGSVDELVAELTAAVAEGIRTRFHQASEKKAHADDSVEAGREFVEAYIQFVHYVEKLHLDAAGQGMPHGGH